MISVFTPWNPVVKSLLVYCWAHLQLEANFLSMYIPVHILKYPWDFPGGQWLRICASTARGTGSIPSQGAKIPHAMWHGQK